ncbi:MAG: phosphopentomutase [Verrucomicrobia bacterium]|nr:phosphopentomutase [Verrucomicrobiota bacterium]MCH8513816.1 phosphopentomutase [Kiritimatiellia bacterium]
MNKRLFLIVMDSVGIGAAPDAETYDDLGAATLQHTAQAVGGMRLPCFEKLGLANILSLLPDQGPITGVAPAESPLADWGAMRERSEGKDTITGHWEIAGLLLDPGFHVFPVKTPAFPTEITDALQEQCGRPLLGNCHGSGTKMIEDFGPEAMEKGGLIIYTSADSVFQIAAHIGVIPLEELYQACEIARKLCDPWRVGRVIARPFNGEPGNFTRTADRVDYAYATESPTILQHLHSHDIPVYSVGKIEDIFAHRGITQGWHTGDNPASMARTETLMREIDRGFVFANFIDFDMHYGHRRDPKGYANCLLEMDDWLAKVLPLLRDDDILILTADHGNDPIFKGSDHTREHVPLLVIRKNATGKSLGIRDGFQDIAQSVATFFEVPPMEYGKTFL